MVHPFVNDEKPVQKLEDLGIRHQETAHGDKSAHDLNICFYSGITSKQTG